MIDDLQELGLSRTAAEVFAALLEVGPCFAAPLVRTTRKHRQMVYIGLEELERENLISVSTKNGKNFYEVDSSGRLTLLTQQKLALAKKTDATIAQRIAAETEQVQTFSGKDACVRGLEDLVFRAEKSNEYLVLGGLPNDKAAVQLDFFYGKHFEDMKRLNRQGADIATLFFTYYGQDRLLGSEKYLAYYLKHKIRCRVSHTKVPSIWFGITGDYIYFPTPKEDPLMIRVQSAAFAKRYRYFFSQEWKTAIPLKEYLEENGIQM